MEPAQISGHFAPLQNPQSPYCDAQNHIDYTPISVAICSPLGDPLHRARAFPHGPRAIPISLRSPPGPRAFPPADFRNGLGG